VSGREGRSRCRVAAVVFGVVVGVAAEALTGAKRRESSPTDEEVEIMMVQPAIWGEVVITDVRFDGLWIGLSAYGGADAKFASIGNHDDPWEPARGVVDAVDCGVGWKLLEAVGGRGSRDGPPCSGARVAGCTGAVVGGGLRADGRRVCRLFGIAGAVVAVGVVVVVRVLFFGTRVTECLGYHSVGPGD